MDRLTKRNEANTAYYYPNCFQECDGLGYSHKCDKCGFQDKACDKLGEYEDLEEQGKLLKLPCAVGDTVYCIRESWSGYVIDRKKFKIGMADKFGKTIFLTKPEAEQALKEMEDKNAH